MITKGRQGVLCKAKGKENKRLKQETKAIPSYHSEYLLVRPLKGSEMAMYYRTEAKLCFQYF